MFTPCAVRSSFTLSNHFFSCLPLFLVPSTCSYSATAGVYCPPHPRYVLKPSQTTSFPDFFPNVISGPSSFLFVLFRILSPLDLPRIFHSQFIFATSFLLSSSMSIDACKYAWIPMSKHTYQVPFIHLIQMLSMPTTTTKSARGLTQKHYGGLQ